MEPRDQTQHDRRFSLLTPGGARHVPMVDAPSAFAEVLLDAARLAGFKGLGSSKAAVVMMTRIMAAEWAPAVRVNAVAPGYVRTEMTARLEAEGRLDLKAVSGRTPQGRIAEPDEIAGAYVYLASSEAAFVTGETVVVDGGWLAFGAYAGI